MSRRSRACEFPPEVRERIKERDGGCIFCQIGYKMPTTYLPPTDIMHIVPRSHGGLGVEENGVWGCRHHHEMMDNGAWHKPMVEYCEKYLAARYDGWSMEKLIYRKENA